MILKTYFQLGINDEQPQWLNKKVYIGNVLNVLLFGMGSAFAILSTLISEHLVYSALIGLSIIVLSVILTRFKQHTVSRIITALFPVTLGCLYTAILSSADDPNVGNWATIRFVFIALPILLFDLRHERLLFAVVALLGIGIYQSYDWINPLLEFGIDDTLAREGWFGEFANWGAIICIFGLLITLAAANLQSENSVSKILEEANQRNEHLKASEEELNSKIEELAAKQELEERNKWISDGLAKFSALFREHEEDLDQLAKSTLSELVTYLKAEQGMLFILNQDANNPQLEPKAAWKPTDRDAMKHFICKGEGMVGQCWMDGEEIYLNNIPKKYIGQQADLNDSSTASVLIAPIKVNDQVQGVVELAVLRELSAHERELVQKLSEVLGITITSVKNHQNTSKLLQDAEEMSEQLLAQEEEMRQTAEDIQASHEEGAKKIKMLEEQLAALQK